jgi:D-glycerate 3-kinase
MNPIATLVAEQVPQWRVAGEPLIIGLCGTQASGKSTACAEVVAYLRAQGLNVGLLGLDDLYLGHRQRADYAAKIHPLFATRGPPGTHDAAQGIEVLDAVKAGLPIQLPRFDKRADDPLPRKDWPELKAQCDIILFEGWCVGARPQDEAAIAVAVNELERTDDASGLWRRTVNDHLKGATGDLFTRIDRLIYLRPPGFEIVHTWRCQQERDYIKTDRAEGARAAMTDDQIRRFIAHYERLTRHICDTMPDYADLVIELGPERETKAAFVRATSSGTALPLLPLPLPLAYQA